MKDFIMSSSYNSGHHILPSEVSIFIVKLFQPCHVAMIKIIDKNHTNLTTLCFFLVEKARMCVKISVQKSHNVIMNLGNRVAVLVYPQLFV